MAKIYVGLAMSSTMYKGDATISRLVLSAQQAELLTNGERGEVVSCVNPSHQATIEALRERFGMRIPIPETAPKLTLEPGDTLVVLSAQFTRRLAEGERYSPEEVEAAKFEFVAYHVHLGDAFVVREPDVYILEVSPLGEERLSGTRR